MFNVAALRLEHMDRMGQQHGNLELTFKPQELCTLLRASHQYIAQPWTFLSKLKKVIQARPQIIASWSTAELTELNRAFTLLHTFTAPLLQPQQHLALPGQHNVSQLLGQQPLAAPPCARSCMNQPLMMQPAMAPAQPGMLTGEDFRKGFEGGLLSRFTQHCSS